MIEACAPARLAALVAAVGDVRGQGVEPGSGPLADQMNHDVRTREPADLVAGADAAIADDDVLVSDVAAGVEQPSSQRRKQGPQMLVHRQRVQPIRDDELNLRRSPGAEPFDDARVLIAEALAGRWPGEIFVTARRPRPDVCAA